MSASLYFHYSYEFKLPKLSIYYYSSALFPLLLYAIIVKYTTFLFVTWPTMQFMYLYIYTYMYMYIPLFWASLVAQMVKCACLKCRRLRFNLWVSKCSREGNGNPLQYSCLENFMDRGTWLATVCGITKSWTWLSY